MSENKPEETIEAEVVAHSVLDLQGTELEEGAPELLNTDGSGVSYNC